VTAASLDRHRGDKGTPQQKPSPVDADFFNRERSALAQACFKISHATGHALLQELGPVVVSADDSEQRK
jgi:hypothetical protein